MGVELVTLALTFTFPGMWMGSGAMERLWSTMGSFPPPQSSHEKPRTYRIRGGKG